MVDRNEAEFDAVAAAKELDDAQPVQGDGSDSYVAMLEAEIEQLNVLLAQKDELIRRADERAEKAHREIEAARRRLATESAKELEQRSRKLLVGFLEVMDDLDRAIDSTKTMEHNPEVLAGIELVRRELLTYLGQLGVEHIPSKGQTFDPQRHEAMSLVSVTDPDQDGRVIGVMREGYSIAGDILRPAGVAVGKLQ